MQLVDHPVDDLADYTYTVLKAAEGMTRLQEAIDAGRKMEDFLAEPYRFPRWLYISIANTNWNRTAKKNGIRPEDLYRQL